MSLTALKSVSVYQDNAATTPQSFIRQLQDMPVEGGTDPMVGNVTWRTLISADRSPSSECVFGVGEIPAHGVLHLHRHEPAEFYFFISGNGIVTIDGVDYQVSPGSAVFIRGNAEHGITGGPDGLTFAYGFAGNTFSEIEYVFSNTSNVVPITAAMED